MGNFSELALSHLPEHSCSISSIEKVFLSPKYIIPVFWLAFFKLEHIFSKQDEDGYLTYYYKVSKVEGLANFTRRISLFSSWYGYDYKQLALIFLKYFESFNYSYLILDINDILGMFVGDTSSVEALEEMKSYLCFENGEKHIFYGDDINYNNAIFLLAGMDSDEKYFCSQIPDLFVKNIVNIENGSALLFSDQARKFPTEKNKEQCMNIAKKNIQNPPVIKQERLDDQFNLGCIYQKKGNLWKFLKVLFKYF